MVMYGPSKINIQWIYSLLVPAGIFKYDSSMK